MKRLLIASVILASPAFAADQKPLVITSTGTTSRLPSTDRLAPSALQHAANNTALSALPSTLVYAVRDGFSTVGDAPPITYFASGSACTLASGAGDGGWQVPTSDGKCWVAQFGTTADIRQWGLQPGGQADSALNAAIAYACSSHTPITIPYPGSNPYLVNSSIKVGNGTSSALSTCNGVSLIVNKPYNEKTSGTTPANYMAFQWNGTGRTTVPFVAQGPAAQINFSGISVDCANGTTANSCNTGIEINNIIEGRFDNLGVAGNVGVGINIISTAQNTWSGAMEGAQFNNIAVNNVGTGGSGMAIGLTNCGGACTYSTIGNLFNNVVLNYDGATAGTFGLRLGYATQNTITNVRIACQSGSVSGDCSPAVGNAILISPPTGDTTFPADTTFIHPVVNGSINDPGSGWTGTRGVNLIGWSTVYRGFPTSTNYALFSGTDNQGITYPGAQSWTPADNSGAGLTLTVADATWSRAGNTCTVSLAVTYPTTASGAAATITGLPTNCRPIAGSGTSRMAGTISYTTYATAMTALMDGAGQITFYNFGGAGVSNASLSGKIVRMSFTFPVN